MKLLLDENLSRRLVPFLQDDYPESSQVALLGLEQASDAAIREYARDHGYVIVTKDEDFKDLAELHGAPPQVVLLRIGNCDKATLLHVLRAKRAEIEHWLSDASSRCVEIGVFQDSA